MSIADRPAGVALTLDRSGGPLLDWDRVSFLQPRQRGRCEHMQRWPRCLGRVPVTPDLCLTGETFTRLWRQLDNPIQVCHGVIIDTLKGGDHAQQNDRGRENKAIPR